MIRSFGRAGPGVFIAPVRSPQPPGPQYCHGRIHSGTPGSEPAASTRSTEPSSTGSQTAVERPRRLARRSAGDAGRETRPRSTEQLKGHPWTWSAPMIPDTPMTGAAVATRASGCTGTPPEVPTETTGLDGAQDQVGLADRSRTPGRAGLSSRGDTERGQGPGPVADQGILEVTDLRSPDPGSSITSAFPRVVGHRQQLNPPPARRRDSDEPSPAQRRVTARSGSPAQHLGATSGVRCRGRPERTGRFQAVRREMYLACKVPPGDPTPSVSMRREGVNHGGKVGHTLSRDQMSSGVLATASPTWAPGVDRCARCGAAAPAEAGPPTRRKPVWSVGSLDRAWRVPAGGSDGFGMVAVWPQWANPDFA